MMALISNTEAMSQEVVTAAALLEMQHRQISTQPMLLLSGSRSEQQCWPDNESVQERYRTQSIGDQWPAYSTAALQQQHTEHTGTCMGTCMNVCAHNPMPAACRAHGYTISISHSLSLSLSQRTTPAVSHTCACSWPDKFIHAIPAMTKAMTQSTIITACT